MKREQRLTRTLGILIALGCASYCACRDAESPSASTGADGGAPGSMTPPGDYAGTGRGGLGEPVNNVGTDGGNLPNVYEPKR